MIHKVELVNMQGCVFDTIESASKKQIKDWAKDRGSETYIVKIDGERHWKVKNNRFYVLPN